MGTCCPCSPIKNYIVQILAVFAATLAMLADGMQFGWVSPVVPRLLANDSAIVITKSEGGWLTQYYLIGNLCGVIFSFSIFSKISRKLAMTIACIPITTAWVGILCAKSVNVLFISRWIGGIGRNMIYVTMPMYIGEIADPNIRGMLGTFMYLMMNIGVLISYALTPNFPIFVTPVVGICVTMVVLILILFLPESPYYSVMKSNITQAQKSLERLRNTKDVIEELDRIREAIESKTNSQSNYIQAFKQLFMTNASLKALFILFMLRSAQVLSGVSVMTMHIHTIFQQAGGQLTASTSAFIYIFMMLTSSFVTMGIMDIFGRRTLTIFSCLVAFLAHALEGSYFYVKQELTFDVSSVTWLPILATFLFVYGYRVGLGTVPLIMVGELFTTDVKVLGVVLTDIVYSLSNLLSNAIFHFTEENYGLFAPFWIFGGFCLVAAILSAIFVPETKGKNLEEIQYILSGDDGPKKSTQIINKITNDTNL